MGDLDEYAEYFLLGIGLIPIVPGTKVPPRFYPWARPDAVLRTREHLEQVRERIPGCGFAGVNAPSQTMMLDVDNLRRTRAVLHAAGEDVDGWLDMGARMEGRTDERGHERAKVMFAADSATVRTVKKLVEPEPERTLFEVRLSGYDILPPSPRATGGRYTWRVDPRVEGLAQWPDALRQLYEQWPFDPAPIDTGRRERPPMSDTHPVKVLIATFNASITVAELLAQHGYQRRRDRWRSPHAARGSAPGVKFFENTGKVYVHHADDPLSQPGDDGRTHAKNAFDLLVALDAAGDRRRAYDLATQRLFGVSWAAWRERYEQAYQRLMDERNEQLLRERTR